MKYKCPKCKQEKELNKDNFYKATDTKTGFKHECKECMKERGRKSKTKRQEQADYLKSIFL